VSSIPYQDITGWTGYSNGVCGDYCDPRRFSSIRLSRKIILWSVGCYLVLNQGFMLVRIPLAGAGIPVGELVLVWSLLLINLLVVLPRLSKEVWIFPFFLWWGYSFARMLFDIKVGGVWTFRDASQEIESLYLIVGFWLIDSVETLYYFFSWLRQILLLLGLYGLLYPVLPALQKYSPTIKHVNAAQSSLFFQTLGIASLNLWAAAWLLMESRGKRDQKAFFRRLLAIVLMAITVAFAQERTIYAQVIALGVLFVFLRRKMALWWGGILLLGVLFIGFISVLNINLTGRLGKKISLDFIAEHMESVTGQGGEETSGAVGGVDMRKQWWSHIAFQMTESSQNMAFGLGFGTPLTDFFGGKDVQVREPHNSYISVWARLGSVGLVIWLLMQAMLYFTWWKNFKLCRRMGWARDQQNLLLLMIFGLLTLVFAIGEPAFEVPFVAIPYYLFFGVILRYGKYLREAAKLTEQSRSQLPDLQPDPEVGHIG
jgi:O-Antigen ligase